MEFNLETYQEQRLIRQRKRKDFIRRYQTVRARIGLENDGAQNIKRAELQKQVHIERPPSLVSPTMPNEYESLLVQNKGLKDKLQETQKTTLLKMSQMKQQISVLKNAYTQQMQSIIQLSEKQKLDQKTRLQELVKQIKDGMNKNKQVAISNKQILNQLSQSQPTLESYTQQIKQEYQQKIKQFSLILEESNNKISKMQSELNQDEIIENALKNENLIIALLQSSKSDQTLANLDEVRLVLQEKDKILAQWQNGKRKEAEVLKIKQLSDNYKSVFETLNTQKQELVKNNQIMTAELLDIRKIFAKILNQNQQGEDDQEDNQEQEQQDNDQQEIDQS